MLGKGKFSRQQEETKCEVLTVKKLMMYPHVAICLKLIVGKKKKFKKINR